MSSELKDKTARGLFWSALNNGAMQLLNIAIGIILARLLSPDDYGLVGMLAIFSALAASLQESGFTSALTNLEKPTDNDYNAVFWFNASASIILYLILFLCAPLIANYFHHEELIPLSRVAFLALPISAFGTVPQAILYKYMIVKPVAILRIVSLTVSGVVGVVMAFYGMAYWSLVVQSLTYMGLQSIFKFCLVPWRPSLHIDFGPIRRMFGFSSKILVTKIVNDVSNNILTVIFGRMFPAKTVGNFTQAYKWNNMASSTITGMLSQVTQPVFVATNGEQNRQLAVLRKMIRFTAFLAFPCMLGLAIISKEFIVILISGKWIDSVPILQILCLSGAFLPLYNPLQNIIISHGRSDTFMWLSIAQIAIQIAVILVFANYGILMMVAVYSAFIAIWTVVWQWRTKRLIGYDFMMFCKDTAPFFLAAVFACGVAFFVGNIFNNMLLSMFLKIAVAVPIYYVIMKLAHAKIMEECIDYLLKRKR